MREDQVRDWKIARVVYEEQFMTLKTITKFYFENDRANASRRLRTLQKRKLIRIEKMRVGSREKLVRITQKGIETYRDKFPFIVKQKRKLASSFSFCTTQNSIVENTFFGPGY